MPLFAPGKSSRRVQLEVLEFVLGDLAHVKRCARSPCDYEGASSTTHASGFSAASSPRASCHLERDPASARTSGAADNVNATLTTRIASIPPLIMNRPTPARRNGLPSPRNCLAARRDHVNDVATLLPNDGARDRRRDRDAPGLDIGFVLANDLVRGALAAVLVLEIDGGAENHFAGVRERGGIDHLGRRQLGLDLADAAFYETLCSRAAWYSAFYREIPMTARFGNGLDDARRSSPFSRLSSLRSASARAASWESVS